MMGDEKNNDEDCSYNSMGEDLQLDESIQELKRISAIPQLKNTEKLNNKKSREDGLNSTEEV